MDNAKQGAVALENSDPNTALSYYTKALIEHPLSPDYYIQRSIAFTRIRPARHDLALQDAELAVYLSQRRAKREKIQAAQHRRVVSLYGLGRYIDANYVLETMAPWRGKEKKDIMEGEMWKSKIGSKIKGISEDEKFISTKEYPEVDQPDSEELRDKLKTQLKSDGSYLLEDVLTIKSNQGQTALDTAIEPKKLPSTGLSSTSANPMTSKIRHEWYQNTSLVTITLYVKGISKEKAKFDIKRESVFVSFPHPSNPSSDYTFSLDPLYASVDVGSSKWTIMSTKAEIVLKKVVPGQKWHSLEGTMKDPQRTGNATISRIQQPPKVSDAPSYPTSSKSGPKNWDRLANDLTAKKSKSKDPKNKGNKVPGSEDEGVGSDDDSGDPVDSFFKKLYAGSDADTRRAMMKSFQESNGTALSTNWSEVGKGTVEPYKSKDD